MSNRLMFQRMSLSLAISALCVAAACSRSAPPEPRTTPGPARTARNAPVSAPAPSAANAAAFANEIITRTNTERRNAKLPALARSASLMRAAEIQAGQMARANKLEHDLPGAPFPTLGARLTSVQYPMRAAGENIGEGYRTPAAAVAGWMASAGHRANILSVNYTELGTAMAPGPKGTVFWVQVFGRPR